MINPSFSSSFSSSQEIYKKRRSDLIRYRYRYRCNFSRFLCNRKSWDDEKVEKISSGKIKRFLMVRHVARVSGPEAKAFQRFQVQFYFFKSKRTYVQI